MLERPNICYIFEKLGVQGCQIYITYPIQLAPNFIFDIFEHQTFQKYSICWVFQAFFCSTFLHVFCNSTKTGANSSGQQMDEKCANVPVEVFGCVITSIVAQTAFPACWTCGMCRLLAHMLPGLPALTQENVLKMFQQFLDMISLRLSQKQETAKSFQRF